MKVEFADISDFAVGAGILGTGGGGDPYLGRLMLEQAFEENSQIEIVEVDDLEKDSLVICLGMMGAPSVMVEKLPNGIEIENCVRALEKYIGKAVDAIIPAEIGGLNALLPLVAGARVGKPVVNCDGMGRAFPEVQMISYNICGHSAAPISLADEHGTSILIQGESAIMCERISRHIVSELGGTCMLGGYPMSGDELRTACVPGTLGIALEIGRTIRRAKENRSNAAADLVTYLESTPIYDHCAMIGEGKIIDLERKTEGGFTIGNVRIQSHNSASQCDRDIYELAFRNEYLVLRINGVIKTIVPDLVCVLDSETLDPINTESLKYGQRVTIMTMSAPQILRSQAGLNIVGPRSFGLDEDFVPMESLLPGFSTPKIQDGQ